MVDISVDYEAFDIARIIESTLKFAENNFPPFFTIPWVDEVGGYPMYCKDEETERNIDYKNLPAKPDRDYVNELLNEKKMLFFTFSKSIHGCPVKCADGQEYQVDDDINNDCDLTDTSHLGYLVEYSALNWSSPDTISISENLNVFDEPMKKYIKSFIRA